MNNEKNIQLIKAQLRCISKASTSFNNAGQLELSDGEEKVFAKGQFHSLAFYTNSGATELTINGDTVSYSTGGEITFSLTNDDTVTVKAVGGSTLIIWIY
jgi:hypothetical protein